MITNSRLYKRFEVFYARWAPLLQVITGAFLILVSIFLAVVAITVFKQQENEHKQRVKEASTVRAACVRSKLFGPPLLDHLEGVENRLKLGALEKEVEYPVGSHKRVAVLAFYRSTIPKKCP